MKFDIKNIFLLLVILLFILIFLFFYQKDTDIKTRIILDGTKPLALIEKQLSFGPRYVGSVGSLKTQDFIFNYFSNLKIPVSFQTFNHIIDNQEVELKNIIARINPENSRRVILGTHYDTRRFADKDKNLKESPVLGANDGASGTAVLLDLARILKTSSTTVNIGIDLILFDGEEEAGEVSNWRPLGSTYFAENLKEFYGDSKPELALIVDMICDKDLKIYKEEASVKSAKDEVNKFFSIAKGVSDKYFSNEVKYHILDDHTPLIKAGIKSFLLIDFDYDPFHTTEDTLDKCSSESLSAIQTAIFEYLKSF